MQTSVVNEHLRILTPNWPLQNTVAVNPFWNQIDQPFDQVMDKMSYLIHNPLYMPVSYFMDKYKAGEISDEDLTMAARHNPCAEPSSAFNLQQLLRTSCELEKETLQGHCFSDYIDKHGGTSWRSFVSYEVAKYASAFFDEGQALAKFPWRDSSFYQSWFAAQEFDRSFQYQGIEDFYDVISEFRNQSPEIAIQQILSMFNFADEHAQALYIGRLSVINNGWASQFSYHHWQAQLGYTHKTNTKSIELIAVQMIIDCAIAKYFARANPKIIDSWVESFSTSATKHSAATDSLEINRIWHRALERSRQRQLAAQIRPCAEILTLPQIQIAMCIDVRSEPYRRAIESASKDIETIGFAGFFGLPFEYKKIDEPSAGARAPVLLKSGFTVKEDSGASTITQILAKTLARSYFRNLRKAPMSSFLFVELFSLPALIKMARDFFDSLQFSNQKKLPNKFFDGETHPSQNLVALSDGTQISLEAKVKMATAVLTHMGLKTRFARLVVLAGHGSHNTNNAFNSASDCGACGGHAGDVNARYLADLLNDSQVRVALKERSIVIPDTTCFVASVHETVTDQLYLLDQTSIPNSHQEDYFALLTAIEKAGHTARAERQLARSTCLDPSPWRRARNWSEVRPEWALAGNSCFIVAPRRFTTSANFAGRSFLHDYHWQTDSHFATLELIMTAPMLVTNWINMQYYASTVAPKIYGSGNKTLHNVINETGVVEGNGGDLRIGLPWQSIHDGAKFIHEPVRLSVFIAAPINEIENIITKHPTVKNLVNNEWLYIFHIDEASGEIKRRESNSEYLSFKSFESIYGAG